MFGMFHTLATHPLAITFAAALSAVLLVALFWPSITFLRRRSWRWYVDDCCPRPDCWRASRSGVWRRETALGGQEVYHPPCGAMTHLARDGRIVLVRASSFEKDKFAW